MKPGLTKAALSEPRRRLVELMQSINFGRIEDLIVVGGDPVLDPLPRMVQEIKFGGENGPRPELDANICALPLRFNLSHTDGLAACTVTLRRDVGVDVEATDRAVLDCLLLPTYSQNKKARNCAPRQMAIASTISTDFGRSKRRLPKRLARGCRCH